MSQLLQPPALLPCPVCGGHALRPLWRERGHERLLACCQHCRLVRLVAPDPALAPASPRLAGEATPGHVIWDGRGLGMAGPESPPFARLECHDVIGCAPDPAVLVAQVAALLERGGLVHVTEPDFHHWRRPANLDGWPGFAPGTRTHWFAAHTLTRLLANHGLWLVHRRRRWTPVIDLVARKG